MKRARAMLLATAASFAVGAGAQDGDGPDLSFLEYLGSWEDGDEEWLLAVELGEEIDKLNDTEKHEEDAEQADEADETDED